MSFTTTISQQNSQARLINTGHGRLPQSGGRKSFRLRVEELISERHDYSSPAARLDDDDLDALCDTFGSLKLQSENEQLVDCGSHSPCPSAASSSPPSSASSSSTSSSPSRAPTASSASVPARAYPPATSSSVPGFSSSSSHPSRAVTASSALPSTSSYPQAASSSRSASSPSSFSSYSRSQASAPEPVPAPERVANLGTFASRFAFAPPSHSLSSSRLPSSSPSSASDSARPDRQGPRSVLHSQEYLDEFYPCLARGCASMYRTSRDLEKHMDDKHGPNSTICQLCFGYSSSDPSKMDNHMIRFHDPDNPHVCKYPKCGKRYKHKRSLVTHQERDHADSV
ncbi:hypothetical protein BCR43DRAFT_527926 [Syncephalastrum racemosum]|uniref:C2H2-type domain-containing protein n=1 Tax=Syncephalastrum racemosum TaxID=13706 RepID=A0A1X2H1P1_SYNRA|nr:hypothetical protein BCR43DRAFT_527926 [Syncephalastrum racemosum]